MDIFWDTVLQHGHGWDLVLQHGHSLETSQTTKILFGNHSYNMDTFGDPI